MTDNLQSKRHTIDIRTIETLVCPLTKTRLTLTKDKTELVSHAARVAFPIIKGVPLLSLDNGRTLTEEELAKI